MCFMDKTGRNIIPAVSEARSERGPYPGADQEEPAGLASLEPSLER